jgi:hypothetical protein
MKGGQFSLQDGCGCPTRFAIVSLTLRDGVFKIARVAGGRKSYGH